MVPVDGAATADLAAASAVRALSELLLELLLPGECDSILHSLSVIGFTYTVNCVYEGIVATIAHRQPVTDEEEDVDVVVSERITSF